MKYAKTMISQLIRLILHIIKWIEQPEKRSKSWEISIKDARKAIKQMQIKKPNLNDEYINNHWEKAFEKAKKEASKEMNKKSKTKKLSKEEVFKQKYKIK